MEVCPKNEICPSLSSDNNTSSGNRCWMLRLCDGFNRRELNITDMWRESSDVYEKDVIFSFIGVSLQSYKGIFRGTNLTDFFLFAFQMLAFNVFPISSFQKTMRHLLLQWETPEPWRSNWRV